MPIAQHTPASTVPTPVVPLAISAKDYKGSVFDTTLTPENTLLSFIQGASWVVEDYFSSIVGEHNDLREIDTDQPNVYQTYTRIKNLELKVSSDLSPSFDEESGTMMVVGSAIVYGPVKPKKTDYFIAKGSNSNTAVFCVSTTQRMTHNNLSVHEISYYLVGYANVLTTLTEQLYERSIKTLVFDKERLLHNLTPLLKETDFVTLQSAKKSFEQIGNSYVQTFYSQHVGTIPMPGQERFMFDSMLVEYLTNICDTVSVPMMSRVRYMTTDADPTLNRPTLWSVMLMRSDTTLAFVQKKMGLVDKGLFLPKSFGRGAAFSMMQFFVYPDEPDMSMVSAMSYIPKAISIDTDELIRPTTNSSGQLYADIDLSYDNNGTPMVLIHPVQKDDHYVLSSAFYEDTDDKSVLETLVLMYLKNQPVNLAMLSALITSYPQWPRFEQYYYCPLLLTLISQSQRDSY